MGFALLVAMTIGVTALVLTDRELLPGRRAARGAAAGPTAPVVAGSAAPAVSAAVPTPGSAPQTAGPTLEPTTTPTPRPTPTARPSRRPRAVPTLGTGRLETVPGGTKRFGRGPLKRYLVEVEVGIGENPAAFAAAVDRTLADPRSWAANGKATLQRVDEGPVDFRVTLASPMRTDLLCAPLKTVSRYSCFQGDRSIINLWRWINGSTAYGDDLEAYRHYLVNHEVGHALIDNAHLKCPGKGKVAPVMVPQTEGLQGCLPNPWPHP
ncbi:MAG TPA: DUF3152 domain-containing protein [Mycobacteriales bacterium]|jgi:hypothetical protein|nr:DUF3152 domain-containing protein [Mycobacteriales bacterium]